jgi:hypothetical protein
MAKPLKMTIAVIGGGPAGLMAAETAMTTSTTNHNHDGKTSRQDIYIFYLPLDVQPLA